MKEKKRKAILGMRFSQGRYSPAGSGNAVIKLSCGHENIRSWNKRPKGYEMKCDFCRDKPIRLLTE
jgi:hypothetical protein